MSKSRYAAYLQSDHWKNLRSVCIKRAGACESCDKASTGFHVHHVNYRNFYDCTTDDLICLCRRCHRILHAMLKDRGMKPQDFSREKTIEILRLLHLEPEPPGLSAATARIETSLPPMQAGRYSSPRLKRLVHLCFELQLLNGDDPFFIGSRDAGNVIGCAHIHAAGFLKALVRDGILILVSVGTRGRASRYKFNLEPRKDL